MLPPGDTTSVGRAWEAMLSQDSDDDSEPQPESPEPPGEVLTDVDVVISEMKAEIEQVRSKAD